MQAAPTPIINFFNGLKQYVVPLFQRSYSWEKKNWKQLWEDIEMLMESDVGIGSAHFLGAVVTSPTVSVPVGVGKHMVIDGQQRLTTLAILLCAIRDALPQDSRSGARISRHYLINDGFDGTDLVKVLPTQRDRDEFIALSTKSQVGSGRISDAYSYFAKQIDNKEQIAEDVLAIVERQLQVVSISLDESEDPYTIFESLNFKGAPLTQVDLARNYFLMRFEVNQQEAVYRDHWLPTQHRLQEQHMPRFLRQHLRMGGEEVRKPEVYAALRKRLSEKSSDEVREYLAHFERLSRRFAHLVGAAEGRPGFGGPVAMARQLGDWGGGPADSAAPGRHRRWADHRGGRSGVHEDHRVVRGASRDLRGADEPASTVVPGDLSSTTSRGASIGPGGDAQGRDAGGTVARRRGVPWRLEDVSGVREAASLPTVVDRAGGELPHRESPSVKQATIEHIMPQTLTPWWEGHVGERSAEYQAQYGDTIGNLTLSAYNFEAVEQAVRGEDSAAQGQQLRDEQAAAGVELARGGFAGADGVSGGPGV